MSTESFLINQTSLKSVSGEQPQQMARVAPDGAHADCSRTLTKKKKKASPKFEEALKN
jgi:hypothetical protein